MNKKWFIILLIALTVINLSALGTLIYNRCCPAAETACVNDESGDHGCYMKERLKMNEEQAAKLNSIERNTKPVTDEIALGMRENRVELVKELMAAETDGAKIESIMLRIDSLQGAMQRNVVQRLLSEKDILDENQRDKYYSLVLSQFCTELDSIKQTQCQKHTSSMKGERPQ